MTSSMASLASTAVLERLGLLATPTDAEDQASPPPLLGLLPLRCAVQHYEWGRRGADSLVARLAGEPCTELWMGTHPAAPSSFAPDVSPRNPAALGRAFVARWGGDLPFLFKVLSVAEALSIQAHLDRELAVALHALRPDTYCGANHKPEMAIAVTEFHALCGFAATKPHLAAASSAMDLLKEFEEAVNDDDIQSLIFVGPSLPSADV